MSHRDDIPLKLCTTACEIRYDQGYLYLDRCGQLMRILEKSLSACTEADWMPGDMKPTGAHIVCPAFGLKVIFDTTKFVVEQDNYVFGNTGNFDQVCNEAIGSILARLDIQNLNRIGFREIKMCGQMSIDETESLSVKTICSNFELITRLKSKNKALWVDKASFNATITDKDSNVSTNVNIAPHYQETAPIQCDERLLQNPHSIQSNQRAVLLASLRKRKEVTKKPITGLIVDLDSFQRFPQSEIDIWNFIKNARHSHDKMAKAILEKM
ncbi:MAG: hypothetical protein JKX85_12030 [Phycisphaeraceae bacterium]|nr:hypothetical protein [Phycisphaeraceae bacterium]